MTHDYSSDNALVSLNEAYKLSKTHNLGCSKQQIKRWADEGKINADKNGKKYTIRWQSLVDYINTMRINPADKSTAPRSNEMTKSLADEYKNSISRRNAQIRINEKYKKKTKDN